MSNPINVTSYDPYELMLIPPNKKTGMIIEEIKSNEPNLNLISDLIVLGANVDWQDEEYWDRTVLQCAVVWNYPELVRTLIEAKANLDIQDKEGFTALHRAVNLNLIEIVRMLIDAGANLNVQDKHGHTPLHLAAINGKVEIVRMLIDAKANFNLQAKNGRTALHFAADLREKEIVRMLIDAGARKDILDYRGRLPYDLADTEELKNLLKP